MSHIPVLLQETVDLLNLAPGKVFVDGTVGDGGHSKAVCERFGDAVRIIALDRDREMLERAKVSLAGCPITFQNENFRNLDRVLSEVSPGGADAVLLDLGVSSFHFDESGRGFSFKRDEPLRMTLDTAGAVTAEDAVNGWSEENLRTVIRGFGEERYAGRIARAIVTARKEKPIERSIELAAIIERAVPPSQRRGKVHPATKTFQAIRIAVNDELGALEECLPKAFQVLRGGGRLAVISFHSLEDRLVKRFFNAMVSMEKAEKITKKPIVPGDAEVSRNPRSRSAKLRCIAKIT